MDLVLKLQNENWTPKEVKSEKLHLKKKVIKPEKNKSTKSREEAGGGNAQRSSSSCKKGEKGGENPSPSPTTKTAFLRCLTAHPSLHGAPKYSSKQRIGDGLNVNKHPRGVGSFVTKKPSWEGKGLGNQSSRKTLQAKKRKKNNGRGMGSPGKDLRSGLRLIRLIGHLYEMSIIYMLYIIYIYITLYMLYI